MWFFDLVGNPFVVISISSWMVAQVLKVIIHSIIYKKFDFSRLFGDGGMPSGHSATVASLAVVAGLVCGLGSFEFAISAILAIIVCHDAMGVRRETGKQAVVLNEIIEAFNILSTNDGSDVKLKEFVGHTPIQVILGVIIGIANACLMYAFIYA